MRKVVFVLVIALTTFGLNAQNFGVRAGVDLATAKAKFDGLSVSEDETGFYVGVYTKIEVSEGFNIRPEVNFVSIKDLDQIQVPLLVDFSLSDDFEVLVGPSFGFLLNTEEGMKSMNFGANLGLSYTIVENFLVEARYNLGISNLAEDNEFDASLRLSGFQVGIGFQF